MATRRDHNAAYADTSKCKFEGKDPTIGGIFELRTEKSIAVWSMPRNFEWSYRVYIGADAMRIVQDSVEPMSTFDINILNQRIEEQKERSWIGYLSMSMK